MSKFRLLAAAALVMGFLAVESASCTTVKDTFSVTVDEGPWGGATSKTYTGSFTWNTTKNPGILESFTTDLPIWDPQDPAGLSKLKVFFSYIQTGTDVIWTPADISFDSSPGNGIDHFELTGISPFPGTLVYGIGKEKSWTVDNVTYVDPPVYTPEPGTLCLMAIGITGTLGMAWRRRVA